MKRSPSNCISYLCKFARNVCKAKVIFSNQVEDVCYPVSKIIYINSSLSRHRKIVYLAHEIGHLLAHNKHPDWVLEKANKDGKVCILEEEVSAWAEADLFMLYLGLYDMKYLKIKHMALKQYYLN